MTDVLFMAEHVILATTTPMHSVKAMMNLTTLYRIAQTRFLPEEHHATKTDLI